MLNDTHFKVLHFEADGTKIFRNADIKGGVAITYRDAAKDFGAIEIFTSFEQLGSILHKVKNKNEPSIMSIIYVQNKFELTSLLNDYPQLKSKISSKGTEKRLTSGCFEKLSCFSEQPQNNDIKILGVVMKNRRVYRYIKSKYIELNHENLNKYKVIIPSNYGSGALGEILSNPLVIEPNVGFTQTFISFGAYENETLANNNLKYIKTKFARTLLGVLKVTQNGKKPVWKYVPLQDFTENSDIDWSKSVAEIDRQLYKKYGLTPEEIDFIETHVKEMS